MLRVLEKARPKCPIEISSTFCGAHSVPKGSTAAEVAQLRRLLAHYHIFTIYGILEKITDTVALNTCIQ